METHPVQAISSQGGRMCPVSRILPEEAVILDQLRHQMHWMADEILRSLAGANPGVSMHGRDRRAHV